MTYRIPDSLQPEVCKFLGCSKPPKKGFRTCEEHLKYQMCSRCGNNEIDIRIDGTGVCYECLGVRGKTSVSTEFIRDYPSVRNKTNDSFTIFLLGMVAGCILCGLAYTIF